jgi:transcriptional regulator with XRE-family HTH domain
MTPSALSDRQGEPAADTIGGRLRRLRLDKGLRLLDLARQSGVPASTISKIENGVLNPSLVHAINLASALEANLGFLVDGSRASNAEWSVVRRGDRRARAFPEMALVLEDLNAGFRPGVLEARIGTVSAGAHSGADPMTHPGEELVHVLEGSITFDIDGAVYRLALGDTLQFRSDVPHRWENETGSPARLLWVFSDGLSF